MQNRIGPHTENCIPTCCGQLSLTQYILSQTELTNSKILVDLARK